MVDPPSGRVPEQGPDWILVATKACGGTPDLFCSPMVLGYMDIYTGERSTSGGPGGGRAPCLVPSSLLPLRTPKSSGLLPFQK